MNEEVLRWMAARYPALSDLCKRIGLTPVRTFQMGSLHWYVELEGQRATIFLVYDMGGSYDPEIKLPGQEQSQKLPGVLLALNLWGDPKGCLNEKKLALVLRDNFEDVLRYPGKKDGE